MCETGGGRMAMCSRSTCVKTHIINFFSQIQFFHTNYAVGGDNAMRVEMVSLKMGEKIFGSDKKKNGPKNIRI